MQTAELKQSLNEKLNRMNEIEILNDANYKFIVLLQTRLIEANVPFDAATAIASFCEFDLSFVNEDDDYVGDVALTYAGFCTKVYQRLKAVNFHRNLDAPKIKRFFNPLGSISP